MIEITSKQDDRRYTITVHGHANYADVGEDIVCSAISILSYSFLQFCSENQDMFDSLDIAITDTMSLDATVKADHQERFKAALQVVATGFEMMSINYPNNVKIA